MDFAKYHGNGNDFIMIDDRNGCFPLKDSALIQKLCNRNRGIGADGIILLQKSKKADVRMRILNSDGSEAESCGNGLSCLMGFLDRLGSERKKYGIETGKSVVFGDFSDDKACISIGEPDIIDDNVSISVDEKNYKNAVYIDSGVPHLVCFVENPNNVDVVTHGRELRNHSYFFPKGTNVDFASFPKDGAIFVRTYERGVENETLACGTGAIAVAVAAALKFKETISPLIIEFKQGKSMIRFTNINGKISNVELVSSVKFVYTGSFY